MCVFLCQSVSIHVCAYQFVCLCVCQSVSGVCACVFIQRHRKEYKSVWGEDPREGAGEGTLPTQLG